MKSFSSDVSRSAGQHGRKTGFWLEEMPAPYYGFKEAGRADHPRVASGQSTARSIPVGKMDFLGPINWKNA
jgi:hypothetical protein